MELYIVMLPYLPKEGRFNTEQVAQLLQNKELIQVNSQFFSVDGMPCCALCLTLQMVKSEQEKGEVSSIIPGLPLLQQSLSVATQPNTTKPAVGSAPKPSEPAIEPGDKPLYDLLRKWRIERAKQENLPAYVYFRNDQLVSIVRTKPKSLEELKRNSGMGSTKVEKYGRQILDIVRNFCQPATERGMAVEAVCVPPLQSPPTRPLQG